MRGLIAAAVSLVVSAVAHIAGGGRVGAIGLALALAFSALVSIGLAGRSLSRVRITAAVLFSQGAFHVLFGIGAGRDVTFQPAGMPMRGMTQVVLHPSMASTLSGSIHTAAMTDSGWMWAAHVGAALLTVVALVKGETTFWYLTGRVTHSLERMFDSPRAEVIGRPLPPERVLTMSPRRARFLLAGLRHRGPPRLIASA